MLIRPHGARCAVLVAVLAACTNDPYPVVKLDEPGAAVNRTATTPASHRSLRFSIVPISSPRETYAAYSKLADRMGELLGRKVDVVQRRTYREVNELVAAGQIDAAILSAGGYADLRRRQPSAVEVIAVPVLRGKVRFRSLIIVSASSGISTVEGLAGKRFAYVDELSISGRLYPIALLRERGHDPDHFFGTTIFARRDDRAVASVAKGLVDGAAVQSQIFEHMAADQPELQRTVRVIHESHELASLPVVVSTRLSPEERARIRDVLFRLRDDPEAAAALHTLSIDGFAPPPWNVFVSTPWLSEEPTR